MNLCPPKTGILLHACCAPCSGAIIEALCAQGLKPTIFWSNSNISTPEENAKRLAVLEPYAANFGLPIVVDEYDHSAWLAFQNENLSDDLASYPERGERCLNCFKFRLLRAAKYAAEHGFGCLATSLASSRWKSLQQVEEAGDWACEKVKDSLAFWPQNWRKGGLQARRNEIIREQNFYNQTFCGCEFSFKPESRNNIQDTQNSKQI
ncbi:MAG TPA: epoxyqueuosine reductase QueH [Candidatus Cryptobacteroides sp.]|jgi:predicted adenine nucleotide alpha hydrolase (AANH) superfamily ATPase|nr:epoxyqueuosine reductase QueH [Rikenellaceae bacterium]HOE94548.1 epoxyqueuosine reductase QueH [Candidatus Cryptobacteroides sp.]